MADTAANPTVNKAPTQEVLLPNSINGAPQPPPPLQKQESTAETLNGGLPIQLPYGINAEPASSTVPPHGSTTVAASSANEYSAFPVRKTNYLYFKINGATNELSLLSSPPQDSGIIAFSQSPSSFQPQPHDLSPRIPILHLQPSIKNGSKQRDKRGKSSESSSPKPPPVSAFEKGYRPSKRSDENLYRMFFPILSQPTQLVYSPDLKQSGNSLGSSSSSSPATKSEPANVEPEAIANTTWPISVTKNGAINSPESSTMRGPEQSEQGREPQKEENNGQQEDNNQKAQSNDEIIEPPKPSEGEKTEETQKENESTKEKSLEMVLENAENRETAMEETENDKAKGEHASATPLAPSPAPFSDIELEDDKFTANSEKSAGGKRGKGGQGDQKENGKMDVVEERPVKKERATPEPKPRRGPKFPFKVNKWLQINSLGEIPENEKEIVVIPYVRKKSRTVNILWPIGFEATRRYTNYLRENMCLYTCTIARNPEWNVEFRIVNEHDVENPIVARTPFAAIKELTFRIRKIAKKQKKGFRFRSPVPFFGLSYDEVRDLITKMPNYPADLSKYVVMDDESARDDSNDEDTDEEMVETTPKKETKREQKEEKVEEIRTRSKTRAAQEAAHAHELEPKAEPNVEAEAEEEKDADAEKDEPNNDDSDDSATETESEPEETRKVEAGPKAKWEEDVLDGRDILNPHFLRSKTRLQQQQQRQSLRPPPQKREKKSPSISVEVLKRMQEEREEQIAIFEDIIESAKRAIVELQRTNSEWLDIDDSRIGRLLDSGDQAEEEDFSDNDSSDDEASNKKQGKGGQNKILVKSKSKAKHKYKSKKKTK